MDFISEIARLNKIIQAQAKIIAELQARLDRYEPPKNSGNSSLPPSHDFAKPKQTKSLRKPGNKKKAGGQPGHDGTTLELAENPDEVIEHKPHYLQTVA